LNASLLGKRSDLDRMEGSRVNTGQILMTISTIILVITVALPMIMIIYNVFFYEWSFDWQLFATMLTDPDNLAAMWNTIKISFFVTVLGTIVGLFFAWLIGRSDIPLKGLMKTLFVVPYMFPPFIAAMAWGLLLSPRSGYINKIFMAITGGSRPLIQH